jgi:hypothetical protein
MQIDAVTFRTIARRLLSPNTLTRDEAFAIAHAAQIAAGVDLWENPEEHALLRQLVEHVCVIVGITPADIQPASPLPIDGEERHAWCVRIASALNTPGADELAYVVAYLVTVADIEMAPLENDFLDELRIVLGLDRGHAADVVVTVSSLLTPGVDDQANAVL